MESTAAEQSSVISRGTLLKQGLWLRRWKPREFVLTTETLLFGESIDAKGTGKGKEKEKAKDGTKASEFLLRFTTAVHHPTSQRPGHVVLVTRKAKPAKDAKYDLDLGSAEAARSWCLDIARARTFATVGPAAAFAALSDVSVGIVCSRVRTRHIALVSASAVAQSFLRMVPARQSAVDRSKSASLVQSAVRTRLQRHRHKAKSKRRLVVKELIASEERYVSCLRHAVTAYQTPIAILAPDSIAAIFPGWSEVVTSSKAFLALLQKEFSDWEHVSAKLTRVFASAEFAGLRSYTALVIGYAAALEALDSLARDNAGVRDHIAAQSAADKGTQLRDLLIQPIQRPPRYALLLQDYSKSKSWHRSRSLPSKYAEGLKAASETVVALTAGINEEKRRVQDGAKIAELVASLPHSAAPDWSVGAKVVHEGALKKAAKVGNYVVVLDRVLLVVKASGQSGQSPLAVKRVVFIDVPSVRVTALNRKGKVGFTVSTQSDGELRFYVQIPAEVDGWVHVLQQHINGLATVRGNASPAMNQSCQSPKAARFPAAFS